jgi:hypothetical protein
MRRTPLAASAFAALLIVAGCDRLSQPKSFDDCILKHMVGVTSDNAARLINQSCREKFPDTTTDDNEVELTDEELSRLTGHTGVVRNHYGGSLHNANTDIVVTSITIKVTESVGNNSTSREYRHEVNIPPLAVRDFAVNIIVEDADKEYSSDITSARGYRE